MSARSMRRLTIAVALALIAHAAVFYFADHRDRRAGQPVPMPAPLRVQLRIQPSPALVTRPEAPAHTEAAPVPPSARTPLQAPRTAGSRQTAPARLTAAAADAEAATASLPSIAAPEHAPAEAPHFDSERVMQQMMQTDRQRRAQRQPPLWTAHPGDSERAASSPFDSLGGSQARTRTESTSDSRGTRVEKVTTSRGSYCVSTPNGATAYRHENGVNLAGLGNCPR